MTDPTAPTAASQPDPVTGPGAGKFGKLFGRFKHIKGIIVAVAGVGAVLSGLAGYWTTFQTVKEAMPGASTNVTSANASALSIAVLPFANRTGNPKDEYVADGITESLTTDLSRIQQAFIVNAATAFTYKDKPVVAQQVGKDLRVRFVLHGSVQRSGDRIRINAQLADTTSNAQLWAESFEGEQSDLFALQDRVTTRIGNSIGREMIITAARESETRKSNPKAADLMLRARALSLKPQSLKNSQEIEALYREILVLEPNNSGAMAALAMYLTQQSSSFGSALGEEVREKKYVEGRDLALKAMEATSSNPGIYQALGLYAMAHDDYAEYRRAMETRYSLMPKDPGAANSLAIAYMRGAEAKRAIELLTQAISLDPRNAPEIMFRNMCAAYLQLGDNDAAIEWCLKSLEKNPTFALTYPLLAMAYALKGNRAKALATVEALHKLDPKLTLRTLPKLTSSTPAAFKEYWEKKFVPAWRKAGLPE
jgi:adenylate cyclase